MIKRASIIFLSGAAAILTGSYVDDTAKWRAEYEASLKAPNGWLSVAGLYWLHEGDNIAGSDLQSDVVLPPGAPARAGVFHLANHRVAWQKLLLKPAGDSPGDVVKIGGISLTIIERGGKMGVRLRDPNAETRRNFTGCQWFPADPAWRVRAKWTAWPQPKKIAITNILGMTDQEPSPGYAEFTIHGKTMRLEPVTEEGGLFFIFKDSTSGKTTYGAGRFLDTAMPKAGEVELDFNRAYNPPCAFTAFATCPLPPRQNVLAVAIEAGEKSYSKH